MARRRWRAHACTAARTCQLYLPLPLPSSYLMHVDRLGCIYHAAARFGLGDARSPASVACVREVSRVCCNVCPLALRVYTYVRACTRDGRAREAAGRFHAWTMAAVTLKRALPLSYASAYGQSRVQRARHLRPRSSLFAFPRHAAECPGHLFKELSTV